MKKQTTPETPSIQSLGRGLTILEAVADASEPVALKQLTSLLGIDRSSVFRLANTLRRRRFLANPNGRKEYILGPSIWRLSRKYGRNVLITFCREHLRTLSSNTGETAHLAVRDGEQALFIDCHVATGQVLTVSGQTGELVPLHATAHGKALLADFDRTELESLFGGRTLPEHTRRTIADVDELARVCERIGERGFAIDDGEFLEGLRCVAAPIRDQDGTIVASIGISAPQSRFPKTRYIGCGRQVAEIARSISSSLGV
jgi:IclR family transcriptional regulator, acetate operon repressor